MFTDTRRSTALAFVERPMSRRGIAAASALLLAAGALYCFAYTSLQGDLENPLVGLAWAIANLLPWLAAFEIAKRNAPLRAGPLAAIVLVTASVSVLLEILFGLVEARTFASDAAFQLVRRVPGAALLLFLLVLVPGLNARHSRQQRLSAGISPAELPLMAHQIDWIGAAGNYLEVHCAAGLVMRRMTMAQAEAVLGSQGFVRIHRSTLVNKSRIARVHRGKLTDEIELADGSRLRVGAAYRAGLPDLDRRQAA